MQLLKLSSVIKWDEKRGRKCTGWCEIRLLSCWRGKGVRAITRVIKSDDECTFEIIEVDKEFNYVAQAITDSDEIEEE